MDRKEMLSWLRSLLSTAPPKVYTVAELNALPNDAFLAAVEASRSPHWRSFQQAQLRDHPACRVCGRTDTVRAAHHWQVPVHFPGGRARELDPANVVTVCQLPRPCHYFVGHSEDWKAINKTFRADANRFGKMIRDRVYA